MRLTPAQEALLPSAEDVRFYQERGYYVSKKIFSDEEIDEAVYGSERFYAGERDFLLPSSVKPFEGWKPEDGDGLRINDYVSLQNAELSSLVRNPVLGAIAARLCGTESIRLWHDQMIFKPTDQAGTRTGIGWHTDRAYWQTCTSDQMLTAWIPFHDCDEQMGTLMFIEGSHRWSESIEPKNFHTTDLSGLEEQLSAGGQPVVKVPMNISKGQVTFHHCRTIHGSDPNRSRSPRRSISVHLQDAANRYRQQLTADGETIWHRNDILCRSINGQPDYSDPDFCAPLWSAS
jgi:ectoine hydroxylase-related dioxygenase (phytanoyl-CoA dioxygenase family)